MITYKKKKLTFLVLIIIIFSITGCGMKYPELSEDAIGFKMNKYIDEEDDNTGYLTIEYNGRTYMPYGTLHGSLKESDLDRCIGYIIQDENVSSIVDINNKDTRVYTLSIDKENNFLMTYYIATTLMNQPDFYRAIDTKEEDISIPNFITDLNHNYWK